MNWDQFVENVQGWAAARGIYAHSTPEAQILKMVSEVGVLADTIIKNYPYGLRKAVGNIAALIVSYSKMAGIDLLGPDIRAWSHVSDSECLDDYQHLARIMSMLSQILTGLDNGANTVYAILRNLIYISMYNELSFLDCCEGAWDDIKDRKGIIALNRCEECGGFSYNHATLHNEWCSDSQ